MLRLAGKNDNGIVRVLSYPGLMMQKLTTKDPTDHQLEIAIVALKAVLVDSDAPVIDGVVDTDAKLIVKKNEGPEESIGSDEPETAAETDADFMES